MKIVNKDEIDSWLFEHANIQGHKCDGIKGTINAIKPGDDDAELVNIAYVDTTSGEKIEVFYGD